jgi:hypothetical protein
MRHFWNEVATRGLTLKIAENLLTTPIEEFESYAMVQLAKARERGKRVDPGILTSLAAQARERFEKDCGRRAAGEDQREGWVRRLVALGCSDDVARRDIALWERYGEDIEAKIAVHEERSITDVHAR